MAEVQSNPESIGETTQIFIEFVMMQAQNAALFLGQIPNPQTGAAEVNLPVAKMFIDQLGMIRTKTQGNLTSDELAVLNNALSGLQLAFVEASAPGAIPSAPGAPRAVEPAATAPAADTAAAPAPEADSRKKFSKSYGA